MKKRIFLICSAALLVLAIVFSVLYFTTGNNSEKSYYMDEYLEARENIRESKELIKEMKATGLSFESEIYDLELCIDTFEEWADTCWEEVQSYNQLETTYGILAVVCVLGAVVLFIVSIKTKRQPEYSEAE